MFPTTHCNALGLLAYFFAPPKNRYYRWSGIDIIYGRRDNKQYSLNVSNRFGNDHYTPNTPHVNTALRSIHASRSALFISTLFNISTEA